MRSAMLYIESFLGAGENPWESTIDAIQRDQRIGAGSNTSSSAWPDISIWATDLATLIGREQPTAHVSIFVPDDDGAGLRLAAQVWGAGEDTGEVAVGSWVVPLEGSVCGRVYRTGLAALCADVGMDPDYRPFPGSRTRSSLTVPIGATGDVLAVINVEAPWVSAFSIRDYERLTERAATALATFPARRSA